MSKALTCSTTIAYFAVQFKRSSICVYEQTAHLVHRPCLRFEGLKSDFHQRRSPADRSDVQHLWRIFYETSDAWNDRADIGRRLPDGFTVSLWPSGLWVDLW